MITSYDKLPIGKYAEIDAILRDEDAADIDRQARVIAVLDGTRPRDVLLLPLAEFREKAAATAFLADEVPAVKRPFGKTVAFGGTSYRIDARPDAITTAQFVDFQTFSARWDEKTRPYPQLISCLLVPEGHRYNEDYDIAEVQEAIRDGLDTVTAFALAAFFLTSCGESLTASLNYLTSEARAFKDKTLKDKTLKELERIRGALRRSGDGSIVYALWRLRPIWRGLMFGE